MNKFFVVTSAVQLLLASITVAEEKVINWTFEMDEAAVYELSMKGNWEEPGMAFWREPGEVSVKARVDVINPPEKGRLVDGLCLYLYDEDDFKIRAQNFYFSSEMLSKGDSFHSAWTMPYDDFHEIQKSRMSFYRNKMSIYSLPKNC